MKGRGVVCSYCSIKYHAKCADVTAAVNARIEGAKEGTGDLKWFCPKCANCIDSLIEDMRKCRTQTKEVEERIVEIRADMDMLMKEGVNRKEMEAVKEELDNLKKEGIVRKDVIEIRKSMEECKRNMASKKEVDEIKKGLDHIKREGVEKREVEEMKKAVELIKNEGMEVKKSFEKIMENEKKETEEREEEERTGEKGRARKRDMEMRIAEALERDKRRKNLILMGIPEEEGEDRDEKRVREVLDVLMVEVNVGIVIMERIGRKGIKARPLRVQCNDLGHKRRLLARARNLKKEKGMENIFIVPDLTRVQQEEDWKLREEVRRLKNLGESNVRIVKGEVVKGEKGANEKVNVGGSDKMGSE